MGEVRASLVSSEGVAQRLAPRIAGPDGALVVPLTATTSDAVPVRVTLEARAAGAVRRATVELAPLPPGSTHELGTVVLRAP